MPYISVVIPLYNEEESLKHLWKQIKTVMDKMKKTYEIIFIDDGSTDNSYAILKELNKEDKNIRVIHFSNNQGKAAGLQAGFRAVCGEYVITMDADLQDDPNEITRLIEAMGEKFDLVSGWKKDRHDPWHKTVPSFFFNGMIRRLSGTKLHDINCGLKAYRKDVVKSLSIYGELYRFIPVLAAHNGFKITELVVTHRARKFGKSKYGISRFVRGFLDLMTVIFITKFLKRPLHLFGPIGLLLLVAGLIISAYMTYLHYVSNQSVGDRPLLLFGILFVLTGLQFIFTGLLAELFTYYSQRSAQKMEELLDNSKK